MRSNYLKHFTLKRKTNCLFILRTYYAWLLALMSALPYGLILNMYEANGFNSLPELRITIY